MDPVQSLWRFQNLVWNRLILRGCVLTGCTTFAPVINANSKCIPNPNPKHNLNPHPTPNQKPNHITLTLTLCCPRYHHRSTCRRSKCWITCLDYNPDLWYTVKPRPQAHMDMIPFEVFLKSIDLIPQQQILKWHLYYR